MDEDAVLTADQQAVLRAVLNRIIPAEGDFSGAGDLDVASAVERELTSSSKLRRVLLDGLAEITLAAWRSADGDFAGLSPERQDEVLKTVEQACPSEFDALVASTYRGYYVHPTILRLVGAAKQPPQPEGYALPPFDPSLLENVRQRGPVYRKS